MEAGRRMSSYTAYLWLWRVKGGREWWAPVRQRGCRCNTHLDRCYTQNGNPESEGNNRCFTRAARILTLSVRARLPRVYPPTATHRIAYRPLMLRNAAYTHIRTRAYTYYNIIKYRGTRTLRRRLRRYRLPPSEAAISLLSHTYWHCHTLFLSHTHTQHVCLCFSLSLSLVIYLSRGVHLFPPHGCCCSRAQHDQTREGIF